MIDTSIASSTSTFAVRGLSSDSTLFLSGKDLYAYIKQFAIEGAPTLHEVDVATLQASADGAAAAAAAGTPAPARAGREDARIEGAVQIAIGVKKEVDFPTWYTNVLVKADMLEYYNVSGCYILRPWSYNIWETIQGLGLVTEANNACTAGSRLNRVVQRKDQGDGCSERILSHVRLLQGPGAREGPRRGLLS